MGWGIGDIVSGVAQIGGAILGHKAASKQADQQEQAQKAQAQGQYEAGLAIKNEMYTQAQELEQQAQRIKVASAMRSYQIERSGREAAATAISNYAGSGVVAGVGSAGLIPSHIVGRAAEDSYIELMNSNDQIATVQAQAAADRRQGDLKYNAGLLARDTGSASAAAAANALNSANWANSLISVGNMANRWLS